MSEQGWDEERGSEDNLARTRDVYAGQQGSSPDSMVRAEAVAKPAVKTGRLQPRDTRIVAFVARFRQVSTQHVRDAFFAEHRSPTQPKVVMKRLVKQGLLKRVERPTVGGANGGSGQYVYYLARHGWELAGRPTKNPPRYGAIHYDWLAVADVFIDIQLNLKVVSYRTEPENHERINYVMIEPDLFVELDLRHLTRRVWLEVDMDTETPAQLEAKMERYHHAWLGDSKRWEPWPLVVWVVPNDERRAELELLILRQPAESRPMYRVCLFEDVVQTLGA